MDIGIVERGVSVLKMAAKSVLAAVHASAPFTMLLLLLSAAVFAHQSSSPTPPLTLPPFTSCYMDIGIVERGVSVLKMVAKSVLAAVHAAYYCLIGASLRFASNSLTEFE